MTSKKIVLHLYVILVSVFHLKTVFLNNTNSNNTNIVQHQCRCVFSQT